MKAYKLIDELTTLITNHGDLPVATGYEDYLGDCFQVEDISSVCTASVTNNRIG